jgi:hypothetical protein
MSQAVLGYVLFACEVVLICWFGNQLTQHVRKSLFVIVVDAFDTLM